MFLNFLFYLTHIIFYETEESRQNWTAQSKRPNVIIYWAALKNDR